MSQTEGIPVEAGRALDALVAEQVMGGVTAVGFCCPRCGGGTFGTSTRERIRECHDEFSRYCGWSGPPEEAIPPFSTSIAAACDVAEELASRGWDLTLRSSETWDDFKMMGKRGPREFGACFDNGEGGPYHRAPTAPHAICLAALEVVALTPRDTAVPPPPRRPHMKRRGFLASIAALVALPKLGKRKASPVDVPSKPTPGAYKWERIEMVWDDGPLSEAWINARKVSLVDFRRRHPKLNGTFPGFGKVYTHGWGRRMPDGSWSYNNPDYMAASHPNQSIFTVSR